MRCKLRFGAPIVFYLSHAVYWENDAASKVNNELFVKKGDMVGLVETAVDEKPPDGYLKV